MTLDFYILYQTALQVMNKTILSKRILDSNYAQKYIITGG